jgi:hypothetical protein
VYWVEVPSVTGSRRAAEWTGDKDGEGIRGLDVALTLNRDRGGEGRRSAPLVASVDWGGPGRAEELAAGVAPGTYWLAVREKHADDAPPVEKPTDWYRLRVWLAEPQPGEEVEPNDAPDAVSHRELLYPEWKGVGERNPLGEGKAIHGTTSAEDPDTPAAPAAALPEAAFLLAQVRALAGRGARGGGARAGRPPGRQPAGSSGARRATGAGRRARSPQPASASPRRWRA